MKKPKISKKKIYTLDVCFDLLRFTLELMRIKLKIEYIFNSKNYTIVRIDFHTPKNYDIPLLNKGGFQRCRKYLTRFFRNKLHSVTWSIEHP